MVACSASSPAAARVARAPAARTKPWRSRDRLMGTRARELTMEVALVRVASEHASRVSTWARYLRHGIVA